MPVQNVVTKFPVVPRVPVALTYVATDTFPISTSIPVPHDAPSLYILMLVIDVSGATVTQNATALTYEQQYELAGIGIG